MQAIQSKPIERTLSNLPARLRRIGVLNWPNANGIVTVAQELIAEAGHTVINFDINEPPPTDVDLIFIYGPGGSLAPFMHHMQAVPLAKRPAVAFYHSEQLSNPSLPDFMIRHTGLVRSRLEQYIYRQAQHKPQPAWQTQITQKAVRLRYYGDVHWMLRKKILTLVSVPSQWQRDFLQARGIPVIVEPSFGADMWGHDLGMERDVPVLWLGKPGSRRRKRLLNQVRQQLRERGIEIMMIDGIENPYVFGEERTKLLNRTKIMLNLLRTPWDDNAMRYYFAAQNGALIVTEPALDHHPEFVAGKHIVVAEVDKLAETIAHYLANETERRRIAETAQRFILDEMPFSDAILNTIEQAMERHEA